MTANKTITCLSMFALTMAAWVHHEPTYAQTPDGPILSDPKFRERFTGQPVFSLRWPRHDQGCVYSSENYISQRTCFTERQYYALARPNFTVQPASFTVPYGFELSFYDDVPGGVLGNNAVLLCTYEQRDPQRYTGGVRAAKGKVAGDAGDGLFGYQACVGPNQDTRLADRISLRKIADITDAQRAAVWTNWQTNDNDFCAAYFFLRPKDGAIPDIPKSSMYLRSRCYGTQSNLTNLLDDSFANTNDNGIYIGDLKKDLGTIEIASRYVQVTLHERRNFQGNSIKLGCGNFRLDTPWIGQIRSIKITTTTAMGPSCSVGLVIKTAWDTP